MNNEQQHQEDLQRLRGFRLIDDDFMNACFDNKEELWNKYYPRMKTVGESFIPAMKEYNTPAFQHNMEAGKNSRANYGKANGWPRRLSRILSLKWL